MVIDTPSIVFFPHPRLHRLRGPQQEGAELVCATIEFGAGVLNPLIASLPEPLVLALNALPELAPTLQLLYSEAFSESPGRQAAMDRLFEYLFVLLIRSAMNAQLIDSGVLMGLSDPRLGKAIDAMHKHPETSWSLEQLAQCAGMSRARFAPHFRQVVDMTPFEYLTNWRLGVAQTMLRNLIQVYQLLGLDAAALFSAAHAHATEPVSVGEKTKVTPGFTTPSSNQRRRASDLAIDMGKVNAMVSENETVSALLREIFQDEDQPEPSLMARNENALGLDNEHSQFLEKVLTQENWSRADCLPVFGVVNHSNATAVQVSLH